MRTGELKFWPYPNMRWQFNAPLIEYMRIYYVAHRVFSTNQKEWEKFEEDFVKDLFRND